MAGGEGSSISRHVEGNLSDGVKKSNREMCKGDRSISMPPSPPFQHTWRNLVRFDKDAGAAGRPAQQQAPVIPGKRTVRKKNVHWNVMKKPVRGGQETAVCAGLRGLASTACRPRDLRFGLPFATEANSGLCGRFAQNAALGTIQIDAAVLDILVYFPCGFQKGHLYVFARLSAALNEHETIFVSQGFGLLIRDVTLIFQVRFIPNKHNNCIRRSESTSIT
uniref:Ras-related protein Rab-14 n=1 Tax=Schistocephalus solidus TaxID=70667 RepID=A0A0X3NSX9_SCHSO